ncbi:hypothetical protein NUV01_19640, partial [Cronobacter sakazakii]|nr:hypothetical protein [Cronobacter sakazakii]
NTDDLFVGKTLLHGDVLMWLMKTLLTSGCTNQRGAGHLNPLFPEIKDDPLVWMNKWLFSDTLQIAPQEAEQSTYLVGQIDSTVDRAGLNQFADL